MLFLHTREDVDPTDTTVYSSRAATPTIDHTYEIGDTTWNPETQRWTYPLPWKAPHMTEEELQYGKKGVILDAQSTKTDLEESNEDGEYDDLITKLGEFIAELEALDDKFPRDTWDPCEGAPRSPSALDGSAVFLRLIISRITWGPFSQLLRIIYRRF